MTDYFLQIALSNACLALVLAIVAMVVEGTARRPHLAYLLWLLVFVKLVTPPVLTIPLPVFSQPETAVAMDGSVQPGLMPAGHELDADAPSALLNHAKTALFLFWLLGSVVVFVWSLVRVYRFNRLLGMESVTAPMELQTVAARIAHRLGLKTVPTIYTTSARISPIVWWVGGRVRVVIPTTLLEEMDADQSYWVLAHELAHVRRHDYLVRWLEWLACVCFWWNPVVWWARRKLRATEEICCDALVLSSLLPQPHTYACSLLTAVECIARPALRPPAVASEINSGGFLERRFKMIVSKTPIGSISRWQRACVLLGALAMLPFGVAFAQDYDAVERRLGTAVSEGELNLKQASAMMDALRKVGDDKYAKAPNRARAYLMNVKKELGAAVEAGKISKEDAAKRYYAAEKALKERMAAGRSHDRAGHGEHHANDKPRTITREDYARAEAEIKKMVDEGKVKPEHARIRLQQMRRAIAAQGEHQHGDKPRTITVEEYRRAEAKMRTMVEEGKAKPEDVRRRLIEMRKAMGEQARQDKKGITVEEFKRAEAKMRKMIEEGKAKPEDVRRRLIEMRKMMGKDGARKRDTDVDWEGIKRRIEGAVKSGDLTRKEADAKYREIKKRMGEQKKHDSQHQPYEDKRSKSSDGEKKDERGAKYRAIEARIHHAVKAGDLSREEAHRKLEAVKKEIFGEKRR